MGTGGGRPRRVDKRGRRHRLAGGGLLLIKLDIVKAPRPGWVCALGVPVADFPQWHNVESHMQLVHSNHSLVIGARRTSTGTDFPPPARDQDTVALP